MFYTKLTKIWYRQPINDCYNQSNSRIKNAHLTFYFFQLAYTPSFPSFNQACLWCIFDPILKVSLWWQNDLITCCNQHAFVQWRPTEKQSIKLWCIINSGLSDRKTALTLKMMTTKTTLTWTAVIIRHLGVIWLCNQNSGARLIYPTASITLVNFPILK